jgi:hypothetical protein|tara:strand:+ start:2211 stop:2348 length:138 start_codon:yes stop_codon:yes gene_type:complete
VESQLKAVTLSIIVFLMGFMKSLLIVQSIAHTKIIIASGVVDESV